MMASLRYNRPILYYLVCGWFFGLGVLAVLYLLSFLGEKVGGKDRISALGNAIYWKARAIAYDGPDQKSTTPVEHFIAEVKGVNKEGMVVFSMFGDEGTVVVEAELADLNITNLEGATKVLSRYKGKRIYVDYYQYELGDEIHDCVVLWDEFDAPVNVEIVERHFAEPIETPPTNIVNTLMASYFWKLFKEGWR